MKSRQTHINPEGHKSHHIGWLRAAVLGANDGIVSTASLIVGVAAAQSSHESILLSGVAGLVAGAMSMAAGEYVSVSSQSDTERADLAREKKELETQPEFEKAELAEIYVRRGLSPELAKKVSEELTAHDALGSHARDELGITDMLSARPIQAALSSASAFFVGGVLPLSFVFIFEDSQLVFLISTSSIAFLAILGAVAARVGGANPLKGALRVGFWGACAMGLTALVGHFFHVNI